MAGPNSVVGLLKGVLPTEKVDELDALLNPATYTDLSGTPGDGTAHTRTGRAAIALGATAATITNNLCGTTSVVLVQLEDLDATGTHVKVVPGAGSFVVTANAATSAALKFRWLVVK